MSDKRGKFLLSPTSISDCQSICCLSFWLAATKEQRISDNNTTKFLMIVYRMSRS